MVADIPFYRFSDFVVKHPKNPQKTHSRRTGSKDNYKPIPEQHYLAPFFLLAFLVVILRFDLAFVPPLLDGTL